MIVRQATSADAARLAALHASAFEQPWTGEEIADFLRRPEVFGVMTPDGFILMRAVAGEGEVLTLAVAPAARRQGLGRRLLDRGLQEAGLRGAEGAFLEVAADNLAALALYRSAGFGQVGRRKAYYAGAEGAKDALVLRRDLNTAAP